MRATLTIDHVTLRGEGVGALDGVEVTVPGVFDGERARVELVHRSGRRDAAAARALEILAPHPRRRTAPCPRHESNAGRCGGCALMELDEAAQREVKRRMLGVLGLDVDEIIANDASLGYRMSSKRVAFARPDGALALGSWARGSHLGADMEGCLVEHPHITEAARELVRAANAIGVEAYDEARDRGDLRYVWLKTDGERAVVTLVTAREESRAARELPRRLAMPIAHSVQGARTNSMRGSGARVLSGEQTFDALGFEQPNPTLIARAYAELVRDEAGALAWDLYAGSGAITSRLKERFERVVPCERYPESAAALGVAPMDVASFLDRATEVPDLVVANPPRKGFGPDVAGKLARVRAPRIAIMSCGPEGLARDLARLTREGYDRVSLSAYDALPQTPHVELVAKLSLRA